MTANWCVFPKFLRHLPLPELAAAVRGAGLDGVALPVRDGFWCRPATLAADLPPAIAALRAGGVAVPYAIVDTPPADLARDPTPLALLAAQGVAQVRIGYVADDRDPRGAIASTRRALAGLAGHASRLGIRVVVQLHHETIHASPSAAWQLVGDLPADAIGVKLDPGNQAHEGWEEPRRSLALLGDHLAAVGVKDVAVSTSADGVTQRDWVPTGQGGCEWPAVARALVARGWSGPFVFSPYHHAEQPDRLLAALAGEVAHLRRLLAAAAPAMEGSR